MTLEEAKIVMSMKLKEASKNAENKEAYPLERATCQGYADGLSLALYTLDHVDTEPVGNPDKMTLTELARELRKVFRFKYLTKDPIGDIYCWDGKPVYDAVESFWASGSRGGVTPVLETWPSCSCVKPLDLSEYKNTDGNIDYSKCIVEVER